MLSTGLVLSQTLDLLHGPYSLTFAQESAWAKQKMSFSKKSGPVFTKALKQESCLIQARFLRIHKSAQAEILLEPSTFLSKVLRLLGKFLKTSINKQYFIQWPILIINKIYVYLSQAFFLRNCLSQALFLLEKRPCFKHKLCFI